MNPKYTTLKFWIKPIVVLAGVAALLVVGWALFGRGCGDQPRSSAHQGWKVCDKEQTSTLLDKLNPFKKTPTKADEMLKDWPSGTRIVEVPPHKKTIHIAVPPTGDIQVPEDVTGVKVYEKPTRAGGLEFRPFLGAGVSLPEPQPCAVVGVDVLKLWRLHTGPALVVDSDSVAGVWTGSYKVWRNVDVRAGGGYGTSGAMGMAAVTIGIE